MTPITSNPKSVPFSVQRDPETGVQSDTWRATIGRDLFGSYTRKITVREWLSLFWNDLRRNDLQDNDYGLTRLQGSVPLVGAVRQVARDWRSLFMRYDQNDPSKPWYHGGNLPVQVMKFHARVIIPLVNMLYFAFVGVPVLFVWGVGARILRGSAKSTPDGGEAATAPEPTAALPTPPSTQPSAARLAETGRIKTEAGVFVADVHVAADAETRQIAREILAVTNPGIRILETGEGAQERLEIASGERAEVRQAILNYAKELQVHNAGIINQTRDWASLVDFAFSGMAALGAYDMTLLSVMKQASASSDDLESAKAFAQGIPAEWVSDEQVTAVISPAAARRLKAWFTYSATQSEMGAMVRKVIDLRNADAAVAAEMTDFAESLGMGVIRGESELDLEDGAYIPVLAVEESAASNDVRVLVPNVDQAGFLEYAVLKAKRDRIAQTLRPLGRLVTQVLSAARLAIRETATSA